MEISALMPISSTKISIPARRPEILSRQRLLDELYDQLEKKTILVIAPAGYGKTSLLIDFSGTLEIPVCWLALDNLDQEPQRFLTYLIACIAQVFSAFGRDSQAAVGNIVNTAQDIEKVIITITNEIASTIKEHFLIILDDYHLVNSSNITSMIVNRFLQLTGENVHVILSSRTLPNIPDIPLLIARNQIAGISYVELAFQPQEIQTLFQNNNRFLELEQAEKIAKETEGWIAAIHLTNSKTNILASGQTIQANGNLFDFFNQEILSKQPPEVREFLLLTSLFEAFDIQTCAAVLGKILSEERDWQTLFDKVKKDIPFSVSIGPDGRWLRYHHLFNHFLQAQLQFEAPTRAWHIQKELAQFYEERRSWDEALLLYLTLEDWEGMNRVFSIIGATFSYQGRLLSLANWLDRIPTNVVQEYPVLLSLQGAIFATQGDVQIAISILSQAETRFWERGDYPNQANTLVRRALAHRRHLDYQACLEDAQAAIKLTENGTTKDEKTVYAEALRLKGQAQFRLGKVNEALKLLHGALQIYIALGEDNSTPVIEMEIGIVHRSKGDIQTAIKYYNLARSKWEKAGNLSWLAALLNNLGVLFQNHGNFEQAFFTFEDAIEKAKRSGDHRTEALTYHSLFDLLCDIRDTEQADFYYGKSYELAKQLNDAFILINVNITRARLLRISNQLIAAEQLIEYLDANSFNFHSQFQAMIQFEKGCLLLTLNRSQEAYKILAQATLSFEKNGSEVDAAIAHIWQTAALAQTDIFKANKELKSVIGLSERLKTPGRIFVNFREARPWLEKLINNADVEIKAFFSKVDDFTGTFPSLHRKLRQNLKHIKISSPNLEIYTFGPVQVLLNHRPVSLADWQTRETRDLFLFLLISSPQTKEEIASVFWPDISPTRLKMRFKTNMYRLRQALGQDVVLFEDEHYRFNQSIDYHWDKEAFDQLCVSIQKEKQPEALMDLLHKSVELVRGPFMVDVDADWVLAIRSDIERTHLSALIQLSKLYLNANMLEDCLDMCQRALGFDPLLEEAYRVSMSAYAACKDHVGVIRQYKLCQGVLEEELGIKPSRETQSLYQQLIQQL